MEKHEEEKLREEFIQKTREETEEVKYKFEHCLMCKNGSQIEWRLKDTEKRTGALEKRIDALMMLLIATLTSTIASLFIGVALLIAKPK